jgi:O-antigen ligase
VSDLRRFLKAMTVLMMVLLAAGLPETLSGQHLTHDIFGVLGNRPSTEVEGRFGMARAYASFDHPILFGSFAGMWLALLWDARRGDGLVRRAGRGALVVATTFCSLSSGCLMAIFLQGALIAYRQVTRWLPGRWLLLVSVILAGYGAVSAASSRSGLKVLLWYLTFDRHTASYRIGIWEHATDDVARSPLFGVGVENWERPDWMAQSIDSFWLVLSMNYGLVAVGALALAVITQIRGVARAPKGDADLQRLRLSWTFSMVALCLVGFTVHFWNNVFCAFFFILGCGGALANTHASPEGARR